MADAEGSAVLNMQDAYLFARALQMDLSDLVAKTEREMRLDGIPFPEPEPHVEEVDEIGEGEDGESDVAAPSSPRKGGARG
jgi:hypothetical protein